MAFINPEEFLVSKPENVDLKQIIPLIAAAALLTIGLSVFLTGTQNGAELVQPVIVVFGGTVVALLVTFPLSQLAVAMQLAIDRGIRGGTEPHDMIRAMMKICDISRKDGLLGVGAVETNSNALNDACYLIGDAADDQRIQIRLDKQRAAEQVFHCMATDVFMFTAVFSTLIGGLGTIIRALSSSALVQLPNAVLSATEPLSLILLPVVCGISLALLVAILLGRLRTAHLRELMAIELAYEGAAIVLEDNNMQRLYTRLSSQLPHGMR